MKMLPLFFDMRGRKVLVIGGGKIAWRKALAFIEAGATLTVIAPEILPEFSSIGKIDLIRRKADAQDIKPSFDFAIIASSDGDANRELAKACKSHKVFVSQCDDFGKSDFISAAKIDRDAICISLYCSGVPEIAKFLKNRLGECVSQEIAAIAKVLSELRQKIKERFPDENERKEFYDRFVSEKSLEKVARDGIDKYRAEVMACL